MVESHSRIEIDTQVPSIEGDVGVSSTLLVERKQPVFLVVKLAKVSVNCRVFLILGSREVVGEAASTATL